MYIHMCDYGCFCEPGSNCPGDDPLHQFCVRPNHDYGKGINHMALPKRGAPMMGSGGVFERWGKDAFMDSFPALYAFLKDDKYECGAARVTGSITIFTQHGCLKAAVNDKDRGLVAFVNAPTLPELLAYIDSGICDDCIEWKAAGGFNSGKKPPF